MLTAIYLLLLHFIGDFICQTDAMALNKSKKWLALLSHVAAYTAVIFVGMGFNWTFAAITFGAHFATDAVTSRINARLWAANERHWFFVGIGADQWLHALQLILTAYWMGL